MAWSDKVYIGTRHCGCIVFSLVAGPGTRKYEIAQLDLAIQRGLALEVTTKGEAMERPGFFGECPHGENDMRARAERLRRRVAAERLHREAHPPPSADEVCGILKVHGEAA